MRLSIIEVLSLKKQVNLIKHLQTTTLNPSYYSVYLKEGVLCDQAGMFDRALEYFNKYIEKNPNNAEAYGNRGITYALLGQYESALKDLNRTIELDKNSAVAYFNRGNIYLKRGQKKPALQIIKKRVLWDTKTDATHCSSSFNDCSPNTIRQRNEETALL
jgi:tetratricopeptide (TPR) repeat protein